MNYDLTGGTPPKQTGSPIEDNYVVSAGYPMGGNVQPGAGNPAEDQSASFFNGNSNKIYPEDRNFNQDVAATQPTGMGNYVPQTDHNNVANTFGQIKYARREGAISIYKDETRATANDAAASAKAEASTIYQDVDESEESQGI